MQYRSAEAAPGLQIDCRGLRLKHKKQVLRGAPGQVLTMGKTMALQQKNQDSLYNRVNDYLRGNPTAYETEESEQATVEAMLNQLQKAEEELRAAQARVDRLVWELDRAKSSICA
jgi:hypothetical protein